METPKPPPDLDRCYTVARAARFLAVGPKTVKALIESGQLPAFEINGRLRIHPRDLELYVEANRTGAKRRRDPPSGDVIQFVK